MLGRKSDIVNGPVTQTGWRQRTGVIEMALSRQRSTAPRTVTMGTELPESDCAKLTFLLRR